jgi:hypothetical protein
VLPTARAQGWGGNRPPYRPAAGVRDLRAVLFNWTWYMGMLRGLDEHELVASLEYQGKGAIQVDGQPCTLTKYRTSTNYQTSGQRIQYTCTRVISFVDSTWLGRGGLFHSADMRVVEKLTRKGDEILYEVTGEDPDLFAEPWVMAPRTRHLRTAPYAGLLPERAYCEVYERGNISSQIRH